MAILLAPLSPTPRPATYVPAPAAPASPGTGPTAGRRAAGREPASGDRPRRPREATRAGPGTGPDGARTIRHLTI